MSDAQVIENQNKKSTTGEVKSYALSRIISAHKADVKSIIATKSGAIISAGRDEVINFWTKKGGEYTTTLQLIQPKGITVNSLAYTETSVGWRLFAGRKDGSIAMYGTGSQQPMQIYKEHENNVCCLHANETTGVLLSGSWDTNVIVWPINDLGKPEFSAFKLTGHTLSVWALASFPDRPDYYLTASADKTIRLWKKDETEHVFEGHSDVVRALAVLSNFYFLSAGNDGNICYWDVAAGSCIGKFKTKSHDFIYSLTLSDSHILTTGEDGTLEFWTMEGETSGKSLKIQSEVVLQTPSSSTWDVKILPSSDIAIGGSDGKIYILTKNASQYSPIEIREAFDAEVVAKITAQMNRKQESNTIVIKVALDDGPPKLELKYEKGSDPTIAAENFITANNLPISYLNEVVDYICQNIPEARAARDGLHRKQPGAQKKFEGKLYDYVLDVTLENGTILKLPFNHSDDSDYVAQLFVEKHNLPMKFLGLLSQTIRNEKLGVSSGGGATADFYDPFTGSGRYVPGENVKSGAAKHFEDPLTGSGRYVPGSHEGEASGGFAGDPLTGDGGYRSSEATNGSHATPLSSIPRDKKKPMGPLVPVPEYYSFGIAGASSKAVAKLKEINERQEAFQLSSDQISSLEELLHIHPSSNISSNTIQTAFETSLQWSSNDLVPVLDFFRIALLHESLNSYFCGKERGIDLINRFIAILVSDPSDLAIRVFVCRCIANAFSHKDGRNLFSSSELSTLAPLVIKQVTNEKPVLQIAASTALANWSLALLEQSKECAQLGPKEDLLRATISVIENVESFGGMSEEAIIRQLQAIATLMWGDSNVIKLAKNRNMAGLAAKYKDAVVAETGKNIARDIVEMTYAV